MNCKECLAVIEEYLDHELDQHTSDAVATHVASCIECAQKYEELKDEQQVYALYEREIELTPALWNGVQARLEKESREQQAPTPQPARRLRDWFAGAFRGPRLSPALTAALVILAIGITVAVMKYVNSHTGTAPNGIASQPGAPGGVGPSPRAASAGTPQDRKGVDEGVDGEKKDREPGVAQATTGGTADKAGVVQVADRRDAKRPGQKLDAPLGQTPDQLVREAEQKYLTAIAILSRDVNRRRSRLDPEVIARFDQTIAAIDRSIAETRRAVRAQPDDPVAVQYMLTAYAKKVEVLKEIASY